MDPNPTYRIEAEAAQALAEWKALFAEQVAVTGKYGDMNLSDQV